MVALNFMPAFAEKVASGRKNQTIRRTARCKPGDRLQLYTGQRTAACRLLGEGICMTVQPVVISEDAIVLDGWRLPFGNRCQLAGADGFVTVEEFKAFFRKQYGLPFEGFLINWRPLDRERVKNG